jgi:hypothetical protein
MRRSLAKFDKELTNREKRNAWWILVMLNWAVLMFFFRNAGVDDAYITYRYADNFAAGHGITWNAGEKPVEGTTTLLFTVILSLFSKLGMDLYLASKIISSAGWFVFSYVYYRLVLSGTLILKTYCAALLPYFLISTTAAAGIHINAGMETILSGCFVTAAVCWAAFGEVKWWNGTLLTPFLFLLRPDLVIPFLAALAARGVLDKKSMKKFTLLITAPIIPLIAITIAKWKYFGLPFPLSFYMKGMASAPMPGAGTVIDAVIGPFFLLIILAAALSMSASFRARRKTAVLGAAVAASFVYLCRILFVMDFNERFFWNLGIPMLLSITIGLLIRGGVSDNGVEKEAGNFGSYLIGAAIGLQIFGTLCAIYWGKLPNAEEHQYLERAHGKIARFLNATGKDRVRSILLWDAGRMAYRVTDKWRFIDGEGLNTPYLSAGFNRAGPAALQKVLAEQPSLVVFNSHYGQRLDPFGRSSRELSDSLIKKGYRNAFVLPFHPGFYLDIYADSSFLAENNAIIHDMQNDR